MARPNLSFEHLAIVLAALGGCAKAPEPARAKSDNAQASTSATVAVPSELATTVATATATPTPSASAAAPGRGGKDGKDKGTTGQASCGAGSCTADMKKK